MQLSPPRSSKATNRTTADDEPILPVVLEFQSPSAGILAMPVPRSARGTIWVVGSMFAACALALGLIQVDRVVSASGRVVSSSANIVIQPLETAIVRSIDDDKGEEEPSLPRSEGAAAADAPAEEEGGLKEGEVAVAVEGGEEQDEG